MVNHKYRQTKPHPYFILPSETSMSSKATEHDIPEAPASPASESDSDTSGGAQPLWTLSDPGLTVPDIDPEEVEPIIHPVFTTLAPTPTSSRPIPEQLHHRDVEAIRTHRHRTSVSRGRQRERDHEYEMRMNAFLDSSRAGSSRTSRMPSRTRGIDVGVDTGDLPKEHKDQEIEGFVGKGSGGKGSKSVQQPGMYSGVLTVKHVFPDRVTETTTTTTTKTTSAKD
ncbi:hypothetical protein BJ508DRAFT_357571 [Ascobolus immersus RN42]|uniref:Uncharacterized protein n=1 Tax=Ascobolus immersus RN42 TaxID=1160509 RepID=A0A3N4ISD4_ASCIM|nr:hypothetical protein BJ508DRAFT_357571 [Ascobolus immersus RN42]